MLDRSGPRDLGHRVRSSRGDIYRWADLPAFAQIAGCFRPRPFGCDATFALFSGRVLRTDGQGPGIRKAVKTAQAIIESVVRRFLSEHSNWSEQAQQCNKAGILPHR